MKRFSVAAAVSAVAAAAVGLAGALAAAGPAAASDGPCTTADGVTVIVDASAVGGSISQRCAPDKPSSGLDALRRAGFTWSPVSSQPGMVCRIDSRPAPSEQSCASSPPANAYWGYFRANRGGDWKYSSVGAASTPIAGGVEGWVFLTGGQRPPGIKPPAVLQRTESLPAKTATPITTPKAKPHSGSTSGSGATPSAAGSAAKSAAVDSPVAPPGATSSAGVPAAAAGNAVSADPAAAQPVTAEALDPAAAGGGSAISTVLGLAIVGVLVSAAVVMGIRRRRTS